MGGVTCQAHTAQFTRNACNQGITQGRQPGDFCLAFGGGDGQGGSEPYNPRDVFGASPAATLLGATMDLRENDRPPAHIHHTHSFGSIKLMRGNRQ